MQFQAICVAVIGVGRYLMCYLSEDFTEGGVGIPGEARAALEGAIAGRRTTGESEECSSGARGG